MKENNNFDIRNIESTVSYTYSASGISTGKGIAPSSNVYFGLLVFVRFMSPAEKCSQQIKSKFPSISLNPLDWRLSLHFFRAPFSCGTLKLFVNQSVRIENEDVFNSFVITGKRGCLDLLCRYNVGNTWYSNIGFALVLSALFSCSKFPNSGVYCKFVLGFVEKIRLALLRILNLLQIISPLIQAHYW